MDELIQDIMDKNTTNNKLSLVPKPLKSAGVVFLFFTGFTLFLTRTEHKDLLTINTQHDPSLSTRFLKTCSIANCVQCSDNKCVECESGFKNLRSSCALINSNNKTGQTINTTVLIICIVSSVVFLVFFCTVCIYFARKYKHKYSGSPYIGGQSTKQNSVDSDADQNMTHLTTFVNRGRNLPSERDFSVITSASRLKNTDAVFLCAVCFGEGNNRGVKSCCGNTVHHACSKEMTRHIGKFCVVCRKANVV